MREDNATGLATPLISLRQLRKRIGRRAFGLHHRITKDEQFGVMLIMRAVAERNGCRRLRERMESKIRLWYAIRQRDIEPNPHDWLPIVHDEFDYADRVPPGAPYVVAERGRYTLKRRIAA